MIIQHTVTRRSDAYTYFFCRNRQQGTCSASYINVAVAERAVERYYTTVSRPQLAKALSTADSVDATDIDTALTPVQIYESCTNDERRFLNHVLFRRLYLADNRITDHEPPDRDAPTRASHTGPISHDTLRD
ncbi:hypothetical protein [Saccharopolyspora sp. 5N708]|uniref:hypothetical protein n=1 Tax=Saccharopolyspora sp. 5N708 TaxID=3457424 RepID=UPI003FD2B9DA